MVIKKIIKCIISSNIWIAFVASAISINASYIYGISPRLFPDIIFIFFASLFTYNIMRYKFKYDSDTSSIKHYLINWQRKIVLQVLLITAMFIISIYLFMYLSKLQMIVVLVAGTLSFIYALPIVDVKYRHYGLRQVGLIKTFIVALVWAITTILLPTITEKLSSEIIPMFMERFLFILALTIPFDIKDLKVDTKEPNLLTLPMIYGIKKTKEISLTMLISAYMLVILCYPISSILLLFPVYFVTFLVISKLKRHSPWYVYSFILDGMILLYAIFYFISYQLC